MVMAIRTVSCDALPAPLSGTAVYFIQRGLDGPVKIGVTVDVRRRIEELQVGSAEELRLLVALPGTPEDESLLHKRFAAFHIRGEWFHPSAELLGWIEAAQCTGEIDALSP